MKGYVTFYDVYDFYNKEHINYLITLKIDDSTY